MKQYEDKSYAGFYNVGPDESDCITTGNLVDTFCAKWGEGLKWVNKYDGGPHEANFLKLDCSKLKTTFGWKRYGILIQQLKRAWRGLRSMRQAEIFLHVWTHRLRNFLINKDKSDEQQKGIIECLKIRMN